MSRRTVGRRLFKRYGGWVGLLLIFVLWTEDVAVLVVAIVATATFLHFGFVTPVVCGAENRDGTACRENSRGLLLGCHRTHHKLQKLHPRSIPAWWRRAVTRPWRRDDRSTTRSGTTTVDVTRTQSTGVVVGVIGLVIAALSMLATWAQAAVAYAAL